MKIRSTTELVDALDRDLVWRKKELTALKFLIDEGNGRGDRRDALLRAGVALLYAHWEGYVKTAGTSYLEFVDFQKLRYDQLARNFVALGARAILRRAGETDRIASHLEVARFFAEGLAQQGKIPVKNGISTKANLGSRVLKDILNTLGLDTTFYEMKGVLIDEMLLATRNTVAHGEQVIVTSERWEELHREVLSLMENVRTAISNAVVTGQYRVA
jgi:hypothetical protein